MKKKYCTRCVAISLSAVMLTGNFAGMYTVNAAAMQEQNLVTDPEYIKADGEPSYIFAGNMAVNPSFDTEEGWMFHQNSGYASNNGHNGSGDKHFYISNKSSNVKQVIQVPYTGYYKAGIWAASAGTGAKFGVKNLTTDEVQELELPANTRYTQYGLEIWMNKGDKAEIYVTGGSDWVNGDDISIEYNNSRFENMVVNSKFTSDSAWDKLGNAEIADGKAILAEESDSISQSIYIPQDGPYYAEVTLENAEGAKVAFAGQTSDAVTGNQTIKVSADSLNSPNPAELKISGKAQVIKAEVKFDLEKLPNEAPTALEAAITGDCTVDMVLEGNYQFQDADNHAEGNSDYQWLLGDTAEGAFEAIEGETKKNIVVKPEWEDKYLKFQVTPVDQYAKAGETVTTEPVGPVSVNLIQNPGFESNGKDWLGIKIYNNGAYAGLNRGVVKKKVSAAQSFIVPKSAYYDFSAYTYYEGSESAIIELQCETGSVIAEIQVSPQQDWQQVEKKEIPLEEGQKVKIVMKGASDQEYSVDEMSLKRNREADMPTFQNVKECKTSPAALTTAIDTVEKKIELAYLYGTDISQIAIEEIAVSEGAKASIKAGDTVDLSKEAAFTILGSDGTEEDWTIKARLKMRSRGYPLL